MRENLSKEGKMKKFFSVGILISIFAILLGPLPSQAFNSAAHVYIAEQVAPKVFPFTFDKTDLYYGSIAPDISTYVLQLEKWPYGFCETHYEFTKITSYPWWNLIRKAFAQGWQIHNEISPWGADYWAHGSCSSIAACKSCVPGNCLCDYRGYVPDKAGVLIAAFGSDSILSNYPELAHFAIEVAIDLLLVDHNDHYLGEKLLGAALFRSPEDLNLLAKVFVGHPGMGTDLETLSSAESTFRNLVINYATALSLPGALRMGVLGQLGVQIAQGMEIPATEIDSAKVQTILQAAIELCRPDYYDPVQQAINGIKSNKSLLIR
jgi:hypothetical protein